MVASWRNVGVERLDVAAPIVFVVLDDFGLDWCYAALGELRERGDSFEAPRLVARPVSAALCSASLRAVLFLRRCGVHLPGGLGSSIASDACISWQRSWPCGECSHSSVRLSQFQDDLGAL